MFERTETRLRGVALPAVGLIALFGVAIQPGSGDIVKSSWKAKGTELMGADRTAVSNGIDKFKNLTVTLPSGGTIKLDKCADCLKKMLAKNRICKESDLTGSHGAVTAADDSAKCNPASDGINVRTDLFTVPEMMAAALAHEWCHTAQANAVGTPNFEIPCYEVEIEVLKMLKSGAAAGNQTAIQNRIDQMEKCVKDLKMKLTGATIAPKTPAFGGSIHQSSNGRTYGVFSDEGGQLFLGDANTPLFSQPLIGITRPFNLEVIDDFFGPGDDLVFVAGIDEPRNIGVINAMVANPGFGASPVHVVGFPEWHPFDTAFDQNGSKLYVLDTAVSQIFSVQFDPFDFFAQPQPGPVFADDIIAPDLSNALSIDLVQQGPPVTMPDSVIIAAHEEDLRSVDRVGSFQLSGQKILTDTDLDGVADSVVDGTFLDDFLVLPGYPDRIQDGDTTMRVIGTAGATIEVCAVDPMTGAPLETLGMASISSTNRITTVGLSRPLVEGESVLAKDLTNAFAILPPPEVVRPFCFDFDGSDTVGPTDLLFLLAGFGSEFGPTELLGLLAAFGQACP